MREVSGTLLKGEDVVDCSHLDGRISEIPHIHSISLKSTVFLAVSYSLKLFPLNLLHLEQFHGGRYRLLVSGIVGRVVYRQTSYLLSQVDKIKIG